MTPAPPPPLPHRHAFGQGRIARQFFALATAALLLAGLLAWGLVRWTRPAPVPRLIFPPAFIFSTALLALGSVALSRAVQNVRLERQRRFRQWLVAALGIGTLFMGVQISGLWALMPAERSAAEAEAGITPFVLVLATLHALHVSVAVLFLAFVSARSFADRYDHEYYWGVTVCAWFWHVLGLVWVAVLAVFAICLGR